MSAPTTAKSHDKRSPRTLADTDTVLMPKACLPFREHSQNPMYHLNHLDELSEPLLAMHRHRERLCNWQGLGLTLSLEASSRARQGQQTSDQNRLGSCQHRLSGDKDSLVLQCTFRSNLPSAAILVYMNSWGIAIQLSPALINKCTSARRHF